MKMLIKIAHVLLFSAFLFFAASNVHSQTGTAESFSSTIIKGFAQWNASRIENIVLSNGLKQAADVEEVERFFPLTASGIKTYQFMSAKALLPLVQDSIQADIEAFSRFFGECVPEEIRAIENSGNAENQRTELKNKLEKFIKGDGSENFLLQTTADTCPQLIVEAENMQAFKKNAMNPDLTVVSTVESLQMFKSKLEEIAQKEEKNVKDPKSKLSLTNIIDQLLLLEKLNDDALSYTTRVHHLLTGIDRIAGFSTDEDYPRYAKFQRVGLFFAALADAGESKNPDGVVNALDTYVDSQGAYNDKRLPGGLYANYYVPVSAAPGESVDPIPYENWTVGWDIYISSYYGPSAHRFITDESDIRFFGPVGVELKLAKFRTPEGWTVHTGGALGVNYAPVDIGSYITNELSDNDYSASFDDILAPSYFFSYSFDRAPVALLGGYQTNITVSDNKKTNAWFFAITFDLPVLRVF